MLRRKKYAVALCAMARAYGYLGILLSAWLMPPPLDPSHTPLCTAIPLAAITIQLVVTNLRVASSIHNHTL